MRRHRLLYLVNSQHCLKTSIYFLNTIAACATDAAVVSDLASARASALASALGSTLAEATIVSFAVVAAIAATERRIKVINAIIPPQKRIQSLYKAKIESTIESLIHPTLDDVLIS